MPFLSRIVVMVAVVTSASAARLAAAGIGELPFSERDWLSPPQRRGPMNTVRRSSGEARGHRFPPARERLIGSIPLGRAGEGIIDDAAARMRQRSDAGHLVGVEREI